MAVEPSAVAVIFTSTRAPGFDEEYHAVSVAMDTLARVQPGFLSIESVRDPQTRRGITVSYWVDDASARAWKQVAEHLEAQRVGRERFYSDYTVVVAQVTRSYDSGRGPSVA